MATMQERLALLISADVDQAVRGLNKLERSSDRAIGKTSESVDRLGHNLTKMGASMLAVGAVAAVGLNRAANTASDLNEAVNLTEQVFGDARDEIGAFAREAPKALGQSERAAREATADFGLLLNNMGLAADETVNFSKDLTVLASDMASFKNAKPEEAVLALSAALRGESEPIRRFGVMLDDASVRAKAVELGLAATSAQVDDYGKAQGRLALIMEQTSTLQGDFARTADGAANASRIAAAQAETMEASIGQAALTIKEEFIGAANDMLGAYNDLSPATQEAISKTATYATGILVLGGGISTVAGAAIKARSNFKSLATGMGRMSTKATAATAAVGLLVAAWVAWQQSQADKRALLDSALDNLEEFGSASAAASAFVGQLAREEENLLDVMTQLGVSTTDLGSLLAGTETDWNTWIVALQRGELAGENLNDQWREVAMDILPGYRDAMQGAMQKQQDLNRVLREGGQTSAEAYNASRILAGDLEDVGDEAEKAEEEIAALKDSLAELTATMLGASNSHIAEAQLLEDIRDAADRANEMSFAEALAEGDELAIGFAETVGDMRDEARSFEDIASFTDTARAGIEAFGIAAALSADDVARIFNELDRIDGKVVDAQLLLSVLTPGLAEVVGGRPSGALESSGGTSTIVVQSVLDGKIIAEAVAEANAASGGEFR